MPAHINLQLGWPSPSLFPASLLLDGASKVLTSPNKTASSLIYGPDAGYEPLRQNVAKWLTWIYSENDKLGPDRICVTNGASGNLDNVLARLTEPGYTRNIWMIEPAYFLACPIFHDNGFQRLLKGVPEDDEGLDIEFLRRGLEDSEKKAQQQAPKQKTGDRYKKLYKHIIYCVPTFANPSAKTMSLRRRQELVRIARRFDALVVADDVYDILRWPIEENVDVTQLGDVPPRIVDVDRTLDGGPKDEWGNAMSNGSFSKIIAPGVRVGWAEGTPLFALTLSTVGATRSGGCPTQMAASFVSEMLETGALENYLQTTVIPTFRSRYYALMKAFNEHLQPLGFEISVGKSYNESSRQFNGHQRGHTNGQMNGNNHGNHELVPEAGGYFIWIMLPADLSEKGSELAANGLEKFNLKFAYGAMMEVQSDPGSAERATQGYGKGIRLSWAWHSTEEIVEGIQRLAALVQETRRDN